MKRMNNNHHNTHQGVDYEKEVGDEDPYLAFVLPAGYAESHSAEDVRKFVMVQIMALVLATLHLALLGLGTLSTYPLASVLSLEIVALYLLRAKHDFTKAALLLTSVINFATLFACLRYGLVPEIYVWLGWVPKILSFTMGVEGGLMGLALVLVEGSVLCVLGFSRSGGVQVDESARALTVNAYLLCFGLTACVHEYCRGRALHRLRMVLEEVKKANDELRTAAEAKSMFLATTSHELRTPLHGILALCDSLRERMPPRHAGRKTVNTISQCGSHLLGLLNNILDFEKANSDTFSIECIPFSVACEAEKVCATFAAMMKGKQVALEKDFNPRASYYMGDPLRFRQIVCNLVSNACKFTPSGGTVRVSITSQTTGAIRVEVTDTGVGIAPPEQARLFQNYVQVDNSITRRYGGTGLGLAISKRLVEAMGGQIGCHSVEGKGSTFWFVLPLPLAPDDYPTDGTSSADELDLAGVSDEDETDQDNEDDEIKKNEDDEREKTKNEAQPPTTGEVAGPEEILKGKRILVVDDNPVNRKVCVAMLRRLGCATKVAADGQMCLDALADDQFDAILMDFLMPVLDGLQATKRIRQDEAKHGYRPVPIIGLTATATKEAAERGHEAGMNELLLKPFGHDQLAAALCRWVAAQPEPEL